MATRCAFEGLDVAVVLPSCTPPWAVFAIGAVPADCEDLLARRLGVQRWPALVFFRDGQYLTTLSGIFDWTDFVQRVQQALHMPALAPPRHRHSHQCTVGGESHCH
ncbi:MAG: hypothetical protein R3E55_10310 [Burkholderiaceae bacterium]